MQKIQTPQNGFIALISILIVSTVLLATTLSLAQFGIANRFFILNLEQKTTSEKLAEACVHIARIKAYNNPGYDVSITHPETPSAIGEETCTIYSASRDDDETTVETTASIGGAVTNLRVVFDNTTGDFISWTELPTL